ncbi:hypothetical protein [Kitasatospora sp. NPDC059827]|uniref:hypothetical protein n=1 Tax=Kitasatospora sp. NPDC059827 TaxID=3346964 RepID=UPI00364ECC3A
MANTTAPAVPATGARQWLLTPATAYQLWDQDLVEGKPHYSTSSVTGRAEVDGLTLWPHAGQARAVAHYGDTLRIEADGTCTIHPWLRG